LSAFCIFPSTIYLFRKEEVIPFYSMLTLANTIKGLVYTHTHTHTHTQNVVIYSLMLFHIFLSSMKHRKRNFEDHWWWGL